MMRKYIFGAVVMFPLIPYILMEVNESYGLLWLAMDTIYYYPAYFINSEWFKVVGEGLLVPTIIGRIVAAILYCLVLGAIFALKDYAQKSKEGNKPKETSNIGAS